MQENNFDSAAEDYLNKKDNINMSEEVNEVTPEKITSLNLEKQESISGILTGIKGQYLMFDEQFVFNVRRHTSFEIEMITNG